MPKKVRKWKIEVNLIDDSYEMRCDIWNGFWTKEEIKKAILDILERIDIDGVRFKNLKIRGLK